MSGGQLVVLDRNGRQGKRYSLPEGIASLGSHPDCDIRFMLSSVYKHHATVMVHANQAVVRNLCSASGGVTLVNGEPVSIAALRHGDTISVGGRQLRWEYYDLDAPRPQSPQPALHVPSLLKASNGRRRYSSPRKQPALRLALEMTSRNSMPGTLGARVSPGSKQVAIVQPQRRDTSMASPPTYETTPRLIVQPHRPSPAGKRSRSKVDPSFDLSLNESLEKSRRKSAPRHSLTQSFESLQTKAALWIESRKFSPRKSLSTPVKMSSPQRSRTPKAQSPLKIPNNPKEQTPKQTFIEKTPVTITPKSPKRHRSPPKSASKAKSTPKFVTKTPKSPKSTPKSTVKTKSTPKVTSVAPKSPRSIQKTTPKPKSTSKVSTVSLRSSKSAQKIQLKVEISSGTPKALNSVQKAFPKAVSKTPKSLKSAHKATSVVVAISSKSPKGTPKATSKNTPRGHPQNVSKVPTPPTSAIRKGRTPKPESALRGRQSAASLNSLPLEIQPVHPVEMISPNIQKKPTGRPSKTHNTPKGRISPKVQSIKEKSPKIQFTPKAVNKVVKPRTPTPRPARGRPSKADTINACMIAASKPQKIVSRIPVRGLTPGARTPARGLPARSGRSTPLRVQVLRKAYAPTSATLPAWPRVTKIEEPMHIDHTKQAALRLMAGHGQKSPKQATATPKQSPKQATSTPKLLPKQASAISKWSPSLVVKKTPLVQCRTSRGSAGKRASQQLTGGASPGANSSASSRSRYEDASPLLPSPRKSALKDPSSKSSRKNESIKFDLSNLENENHYDVIMIDSTNDHTESLALQYSETLISKSPSPRRSLHSRSSKMLESVGIGGGTTLSDTFLYTHTPTSDTLTPPSPPSPKARNSIHSTPPHSTLTPSPHRKSARGTIILQKALQMSGVTDVSTSGKSAKTIFEESMNVFQSRKSSLSTKGEMYSIVDLVSVDSDESGRSYNSARSTNASTAFGTPQNKIGRKTRSTIEPLLLATSTPFGKRKSLSRSPSVPNLSTSTPVKNTSISRSLSTPENSNRTTINATRVSRMSKSRSRLNDSDSILLSMTDLPDESPKSSKKSRPSPTPFTVSTSINKQARSRRSLVLSPVATPSVEKSRRSKSTETSRNVSLALNDTTASLEGSASYSPRRLKESSVRVSSTKNKSRASRSAGRSVDILVTSPSPKSVSKRTSKSFASDQSSIMTAKDDSVQISARRSQASARDSLYDSSHKSNAKHRATKSVGSSRNSTMLSANDELVSVPQSRKKSSVRQSKISPIPTNKSQATSSTGSSPNISTFSPNTNASSHINNTRKSLKRSLSSPEVGSRSPSPKKSRTMKSVDKSGNSSISSPKGKSGQRLSLKISLIQASPHSHGMVTPENEITPDKAETPVLNIQSLLETSRNPAVSPKSGKGKKGTSVSKRQTAIGVMFSGPRKGRSSLKSKSLSLSTRRTIFRPSKDSSASSDKTDEGAMRPEEDITPRSSVKIVPEAVKNRHSTAKKPQSKRSIIDNLNDSDSVKQLFSSPVKRKLSQSMTEYSKNESLVEKKSKRASKSSLTHNDATLTRSSQSINVEEFVSPLTTPSNSPNVSGIERLHKNNTTPQARKSVRNDLTNESGVKLVFAMSPKNRLSDMRGVKKVFASSPKNDLRRVTGVTALFKTHKSPKNDLSNIQGVKNMFRKSVRNDLSNVSGVKQTFKNQPRNSLSNVSGVKHLYREDKNSLSDLSGVEELFNDSSRISDSEALFDELVGKPKIKATYSAKSFINTKPKKKNQKKTKSLIPLDLIENNPEVWLEQELRKRVEKNISTSKKSLDQSRSKQSKSAGASPIKSKIMNRSSGKLLNVSKTIIPRELQKLTTATVEGCAPLRDSRVRASHQSLSRSYERKLPLKKRSIVEASLESSSGVRNKSRELPIKKRALVHSTPLRANATVNASVLGRESPIVAALADITAIANRGKQQKSPKSKQSLGRKSDITASGDAPTILVTSKSRVNVTTSPAEKPVAGRKGVSKANKNKSSLSVVKKSPIKSPKVNRRGRNTKAEVTQPEIFSPLKLRQRRTTSKAEKTVSPKNSRAKKRKSIVVVSKPSAKLKPQPAAAVGNNKSSLNKAPSPKVASVPSPKPARSRKASSKVEAKVAALPPASRRGRKTVPSVPATPVKTGVKRGRKDFKPNPATKSPPGPSRRGRRAAEPETEVASPSLKKHKAKSPAPKRARNPVSSKESPKASEVQTPGPSPIKPRRGRNAVVVAKQTPKRGRKTVLAKKLTPKAKVSPVHSPIKPRRGRNTTVATPKRAQPVAKRGQKAPSVQAKKLTPKKKATPVQSPIKQVKKITPQKPPAKPAKKASPKKKAASPVKFRGRSRQAEADRKRKADAVSLLRVAESKAKRGKQSPKKNTPRVEEKKLVSPKKTRGAQKLNKAAPAESPKGRKRKAADTTPAKGAKQPATKRSRKSLSVSPSPVKPRSRAAIAAKAKLDKAAVQLLSTYFEKILMLVEYKDEYIYDGEEECIATVFLDNCFGRATEREVLSCVCLALAFLLILSPDIN